MSSTGNDQIMQWTDAESKRNMVIFDANHCRQPQGDANATAESQYNYENEEWEIIYCDDWFVGTNNCQESDIEFLRKLIDNSQEGDNPPPSDLSPIDLGYQVWDDG